MRRIIMKKTPSLFKRDYEGTRLVLDEVVEGSEWVLAGEGVATVKYDGTSCKIDNGQLYKRYDRKLTKAASRRRRRGHQGPWSANDLKPAPRGWEPCEPEPNVHTRHWPGWLPVGDGPEDQWHREAFDEGDFTDGTYELVGPAIQGNPHGLENHQLWKHGAETFEDLPTDFEGLRQWLSEHHVEGIVWHHPDGRKAKLKRKDFGLTWP
jgi:hypothetical protein